MNIMQHLYDALNKTIHGHVCLGATLFIGQIFVFISSAQFASAYLMVILLTVFESLCFFLLLNYVHSSSECQFSSLILMVLLCSFNYVIVDLAILLLQWSFVIKCCFHRMWCKYFCLKFFLQLGHFAYFRSFVLSLWDSLTSVLLEY